MNRGDRVLFCGCAYTDLVPRASAREVLKGLARRGVNVTAVPDLCALAAGKARLLGELSRGPLTVIACYPRAVKWLFAFAGAELDTAKTTCLNMRTQSPAEILDCLPGPGPDAAEGTAKYPERRGGWVPWFPVIDYDRCRDCGQCAQFCLFGVYEENPAGGVRVVHPANCKTNCPACARICPEAAIMFPKLDESPINGAEVLEEPGAQPGVRVDLDAALGGDARAVLAERRRRKNARLFREDFLRRAMAERSACSAGGGEADRNTERDG